MPHVRTGRDTCPEHRHTATTFQFTQNINGGNNMVIVLDIMQRARIWGEHMKVQGYPDELSWYRDFKVLTRLIDRYMTEIQDRY